MHAIIFLICCCLSVFSQTKINYAQLKKEHKLSKEIFQHHSQNTKSFYPPIAPSNYYKTQSTSTGCNCLIPRDTAFHVVPLLQDTGFGGGIAPDYRCDDCSTFSLKLPFTFCFYGQNFDSVYINNNGNVSFFNYLLSFTAGGFPAGQDTTTGEDTCMIAPFWADVDTQGPLSGLVRYKVTPTSLIVKWDSVGFFSSHDSLLNTFQLIITDGNDPIIPGGNNVSFCYGDMQWTTGDASNGVNGIGGDAATVGANKGDSINFIQFGRFDTTGTQYDGPFGADDGVDFLDNKSFVFNTCVTGSNNNIPPVLSSQLGCDTLVFCVGDTLLMDINFLSPEQGQITTATISANGMTGLSIVTSTSGYTAFLKVKITANTGNLGVHTFYMTATDNGSPAQTTTVPVIVKVIPGFSVTVSSAAVCGGQLASLSAGVSGGSLPYSFLWSPAGGNNAMSDSLPAGNYTVTVTDAKGCVTERSAAINISTAISLSLTPTNETCTGVNDGSMNVTASGGVSPYKYLWSNGATQASVINLQASVYSVTVTDANGCNSKSSTTVGISFVFSAFASGGTSITQGESATLSASTSGSTGTANYQWSPLSGLDCSTCKNPAASPIVNTIYCVTVTDPAGCVDSACTTITTELKCEEIFLPNAFSPNEDGNNDLLCLYGNKACIQSFSLAIYDRWGEQVFKSKDPKDCWNGTDISVKENTNIFIYHLDVVLTKGEHISKTGNITLVK